MLDLGFQSGDYVRCPLKSFQNQPYPEAQLICFQKIDDLNTNRQVWWAYNCRFKIYPNEWCPIITVSCGDDGWILNEIRTVWRECKPWIWDEIGKTWKLGIK